MGLGKEKRFLARGNTEELDGRRPTSGITTAFSSKLDFSYRLSSPTDTICKQESKQNPPPNVEVVPGPLLYLRGEKES